MNNDLINTSILQSNLYILGCHLEDLRLTEMYKKKKHKVIKHKSIRVLIEQIEQHGDPRE